MNEIVQHILNEDILIPVFAILMGSIIAIIAMITTAMRGIAVSKAREQTKRELAAYVAEGTLDPDKAVAMINAGRQRPEQAGGSAQST
jgi:hypothetical protein